MVQFRKKSSGERIDLLDRQGKVAVYTPMFNVAIVLYKWNGIVGIVKLSFLDSWFLNSDSFLLIVKPIKRWEYVY